MSLPRDPSTATRAGSCGHDGPTHAMVTVDGREWNACDECGEFVDALLDHRYVRDLEKRVIELERRERALAGGE